MTVYQPKGHNLAFSSGNIFAWIITVIKTGSHEIL